MNFGEICLAAFIGMLPMTLFSYIVSMIYHDNYSEPELLNFLIFKQNNESIQPAKKVVGWLVHYGVSIVFAFLFYFIWKSTVIDPTAASAIFLGLAAGIVGMMGWYLFLTFSNRLPKINIGFFLVQLIPAHVIFGLGIYVCYIISH